MDCTVNGVRLHYEKSGAGPPVVLLHGNGESGEIFDKLIPALSKTRTVYALDSRCHGQSEKTSAISYELMAEDTAAVIRALGLGAPAVYGFSDGGIIALLLGIRYPDCVGKIAASGANLSPEGLTPGFRRILKVLTFFDRSPATRMMRDEPNIPPEALGKIRVPVLLLAGEKDLISRAHTELMAAHIPDCTLRILPAESHGSYIVHSEKLFPLLAPFL